MERPTELVAEALPGVVLSRDSKVVTSEVDGRINKLLVQPGQRVTAGSPLAIVDDGELRRQLEAARGAEDGAIGDLRRTEGEWAETGRRLKQVRGLLSDGAVSRDAVSSARSAHQITSAQVQAASGSVRRARAAREQAEQQLGKTTITAPIDGLITLVKVSEGQLAVRGQPIARVFDPSDLWVRFAVPPERREEIKAGDTVIATPLRPGAAPLTAVVRIVHRTLEPPLQFAVVEADVDETTVSDRDALLGAMVDVRFE